MDRAAFGCGLGRHGTSLAWSNWILPQVFLKFRLTMIGSRQVIYAFSQREYVGALGVAQTGSSLDDSVENWLQLIGRTADDIEYVARCGLVFKGLLQLAFALLLSLEQPRVLDGDHGLVSEGLDERDLLVIERRDPGPRQRDDADRVALQQQGHG